MTVGRIISFKFLPLLLLFYTNYPPITCQNCGLPKIIRVSDQLTESLDTGQSILPPIPLQNVVNVSKVTRNPGNFANVLFFPETASSCAQLALQVATPLWQPPEISYVDKTRLSEIGISVELECSDGRHKEVQIIIPIIDENTAMPHFEKDHYDDLTTEPCILDRCVLTFDKEIKVIDKDRDAENAGIELWTNVPHMINFLHGYSVLESWYEEEKDGMLAHKGYQLRAKLEYVPEDKTKSPHNLNFTIYAKNTISPADSYEFVAETTVIINFKENSHRLTPPVFTHPLYHAYVQYEAEQVYTKPGNIYAYVPGQDHNNSDIEYVIEGEPSIEVDGKGVISFIKDFGVMRAFRNTRVDYNVTAVRNRSIGEGIMHVNTTVPLVVFFFFHDDSTTTPPDCNCEPVSTPWPGICPSPECPDPDPCPGTTAATLPTSGQPEPSTTEQTVTDHTTTSEQPDTTMTEQTSTYSPSIAPSHGTGTPTRPTYNPTTESPIPESTTPFIPTRPPSECSCECSSFSCERPQTKPSLNTTYYLLYPDPYNCTAYHRCPSSVGGPVYDDDKQTFYCQTGTVFCPVMSACTTVEMCLNRTYNYSPPVWKKGGYGDDEYEGRESGEDECSECECNDSGLNPDNPENVCTPDNHHLNIPDSQFLDVFHKCQAIENDNQESYIDYSMLCPTGLVFCPIKGECGYPNDPECRGESNKLFKQCDVCVMGKWEGFDIFKQRYI